MSNIEKTRLELAKKAMKLKRKIDELQVEQNEILADMMETSGGESFTVPVPGKGQVQVVRATEGGIPQGVFDYIFSKDAFLTLSEARRRALTREGVVTLQEKVSSSRKASLRVKFNA